MLSHIKWSDSTKHKQKDQCLMEVREFRVSAIRHKNLPIEVNCIKKRSFRYNNGNWFGNSYTFHYIGRTKYAQQVHIDNSKYNYQWTEINSPGSRLLEKGVPDITRSTVHFYEDLFSFIEILHAIEMVTFLTQNKVLLPDIKNHIYKMCVEFCVKLEKKYIPK